MDLKRYERITGREALKQLLEGHRVYFERYGVAQHYEISDNRLLVTTSPSGESYATLQSFLVESDANWYVKKPFDVRAEMLARPNEWVGAYQSPSGTWYKVGLDTSCMFALETKGDFEKPDRSKDLIWTASPDKFDSAIPIEDVPEEANQ